ncbi:MAG: HDOD domain-containing protein [Desulfobacterales bacterium]|nr:HDOD domain-containing protein [Desulfobacterales bacterium]MCK5416881.1 HDOD domain-containing protein [Desulfobacterales bacterium]
MTNIEDIISGIDTLTPIPPVAAQIMALAEDENSSMSDISDLIIHDPSITASLLKICNSAYFGLARKVESVRDAITLLGLDQIVELVLLNTTAENFKDEPDGYGLGEGELWHHAVLSAHVAKTLAENYGVANKKYLIFTAALLKDIGKLIMGRYVAFSYEKINILVESKGYSFNEAEKKVIGMNHEELGGVVGQKWRFGKKLIYIIRNHHMSEEASRNDVETALVYLADIVCMMMGFGTGVDGLAYRFYSDVLDRMKLTDQDLQKIIFDTGEERQKIQMLLNLV